MGRWVVEPEHEGARVDTYLARAMDVSRAAAQRLLETGSARVNGAAAKPNLRLRTGDRLEAEQPAPAAADITPEEIPLRVLFEDGDLLVIDKPRGMVVHPAPGAAHGTLVHAVLAHADDLSGIGGEERPGIVHRLDKNTSGLLVVAKTDTAHRSLQAQIQAHTAERRYEAVLWGIPKAERMEIDAPIGRHPVDRKKMAVITDPRRTARHAVTELTLEERLGPFCRAEARLRTGRTHQIRVHCAYIGHPVVGDETYGGLRKVSSEEVRPTDRQRVAAAIEALHGQALHARYLAFDHPRTGARLEFEAEPPPVMRELVAVLREVYGR